VSGLRLRRAAGRASEAMSAASKAAARARFEARYPKVKHGTRKPSIRVRETRTIAPEPEIAERPEPRFLGTPRNGGHVFDLSDRYKPAPGFVDEWERRARALSPRATHYSGDEGPAKNDRSDMVSVDLEFGERVKAARNAAQLTRAQVGRRLGTTAEYVGALERGKDMQRIPRRRHERLCQIVGIEVGA
jgi:DNA-binding XRE family transcriptional regulator